MTDSVGGYLAAHRPLRETMLDTKKLLKINGSMADSVDGYLATHRPLREMMLDAKTMLDIKYELLMTAKEAMAYDEEE